MYSLSCCCLIYIVLTFKSRFTACIVLYPTNMQQNDLQERLVEVEYITGCTFRPWSVHTTTMPNSHIRFLAIEFTGQQDENRNECFLAILHCRSTTERRVVNLFHHPLVKCSYRSLTFITLLSLTLSGELYTLLLDLCQLTAIHIAKSMNHTRPLAGFVCSV